MKKAAAQTNPVTLGTKRACTKCASKFYDFGKPTIQCPKCGTEIDPDAELRPFRQPAEAKKAPKPKEGLHDEDDVLVGGLTESAFESVEDLGDSDDDDGLDNLGKNEDDDEDGDA